MSKVGTFETDLLELLFNNTTIAGIGDTTGITGSGSPGSFYVALFKSNPGDSEDVTNECVYGGYGRVGVVRTTSGWSVSGDTVSNVAAITFGQCTAGSESVTHFGICKADVESTADLIYSGVLDSPLAVSSGITPEFAIGDLTVTED